MREQERHRLAAAGRERMRSPWPAACGAAGGAAAVLGGDRARAAE